MMIAMSEVWSLLNDVMIYAWITTINEFPIKVNHLIHIADSIPIWDDPECK